MPLRSDVETCPWTLRREADRQRKERLVNVALN